MFENIAGKSCRSMYHSILFPCVFIQKRQNDKLKKQFKKYNNTLYREDLWYIGIKPWASLPQLK